MRKQNEAENSFERMYLREWLEFLVSLKVALVVLLGIIFGDGVFVPFVRLCESVNRVLGWKGMNATAGYIAFCLMLITVTATPFVIMRLTRQSRMMHYFLFYVAGLILIAAAPFGWFWIVDWYGWYPFETGICLVLTGIYMCTKWRIPALLMVLVGALHYAFWYYLSSGSLADPIRAFVPVVGFCGCALWSFYVARARSRDGSNGIPNI